MAAAPRRRTVEERKGDRNESQTVLRACEVLKAFRNPGEELVLGDVVHRTHLPKTTVFRLLRTLIHGGLLERSRAGVYRNQFGPVTARPFRIGFAAQGDSEFSREVVKSMEKAADREHVHLITVNNRYSAREAVRNADLLIKERVDLVLEFQTYERVALCLLRSFSNRTHRSLPLKFRTLARAISARTISPFPPGSERAIHYLLQPRLRRRR